MQRALAGYLPHRACHFKVAMLVGRFRGFEDVRREIESETIRVCGAQRALPPELQGLKRCGHCRFENDSKA